MTAAALEKEGIRKKRQSPLVNAGYAARIAAMTDAVQSFLSFHNTAAIPNDPSETPLQVVSLGCGLDILGLWALCQKPKGIRLFELDTLEIVMAKKELLISMGWLQVTSTNGDEKATVVEGTVHPKMSVQDRAEDPSVLYPHNYTLSACDLKNLSSVETALSNLDRNIPTLVVSELVLVYLGRKGIDDLLSWCASTMCVARGSALVAYEALGPSAHGIRSVHSVIEGYKRQYCANFRDKLHRGIASDDDKSNDQDDFHPLGDSPGSVKKRFTAAGFPSAHAALAGTVAACIFGHDKYTKQNRSFQPSEPFDEHAALALHLHSYIFLCAFPDDTDINLIRSMCPWSTTSCYDMKPKVVRVDDNSEIMIAPIEAADQCQVQELFTGTYEVLSQQFPAVRKMVKTALQSDLNFSPPNGTFSSIGLRYQSCGGVFLVAVEISAPNADDAKSRSLARTVIGCLGIRLCNANEGTVRENAFEIHRLAVDPSARGRGVGKALLASVQDDFLRFELGDDEPFRLVATTPALLTAANHLYVSTSGFEMQKQETIGKMTINTYVKESARPKIHGTRNELI
jgi:O-methyltransferase involved in polyketide biosynthesis/GNAT superfamily N-acetyltransferase